MKFRVDRLFKIKSTFAIWPTINLTGLKTISEFHRLRGLPAPEHPLISVINVEDIKNLHDNEPSIFVYDFYSISLKRNCVGKMKYGQQEYDFDEGIMFFISPGQVFRIEHDDNNPAEKRSGWMLLIHPDFLWNTPWQRP